MDLALRNSRDYLTAIFSGEFTLDEAERTFLELVEAVERYQASNVLVDGRTVSGEPSTMDRFAYGDFVSSAVAGLRVGPQGRPPRFSYVLEEPVLDPHRLGETVAVNRGMNVRVFDNINDALAWLGVASAEA